MSTLQVSNISDGTTTVGTEYVVNGSAKAWAAYTQYTTQSLDDSLNVSSITDTGVGDSRFTYTNAFSSAVYSLTAQGKRGTNALGSVVGHRVAPTSTTSDLVHDNGAGGPQDCSYCGLHVQGDLA
jgi:hypothetical protein